jgi:hypothetical protein
VTFDTQWSTDLDAIAETGLRLSVVDRHRTRPLSPAECGTWRIDARCPSHSPRDPDLVDLSRTAVYRFLALAPRVVSPSGISLLGRPFRIE